jgi:hypothetical protein
VRGLWIVLVWSLATLAPARQGWLLTREGRTLHGDVVFTNGAFLVVAAEQSSVPLAQVARLKLDAAAPRPVPAGRGQGNGLLGYYFNRTNLTGDVVVRLDETIDFDWGTEAPAFRVDRDYFSVLWMGELEAPASGEFTLGLATDDGSKLFLDDRLVCESWQRQEAVEVTGVALLAAGRRHRLRLEYFEFFGNARARLFWSGPGLPKEVIPRRHLFAASFLKDHAASLTAAKGLLATYYRHSDFTGPTFTHVEPTIDLTGAEGVPAPNFSPNNSSVRWSGQVRAGVSEVHTFYLATDEPARLWLSGQLLVEQTETSFTERSESVPLKQGEAYDLVVEARNTGGPLAARLLWSSPSLPKTTVPAANLSPSRPTPTRNVALDKSLVQPPGVRLRNGSFIASQVEQATDAAVRVTGWLDGQPVSRVNVARIYFQDVPQAVLQHVAPGRRGALLPTGDFIDGELRRLEAGRVRLSSILFGTRVLDAPQGVLAVFLQDVSAPPGLYEVSLRDRSVLRAATVTVEPEALGVQDAMLGRLKIPAEDVVELQGR